MTLENITGSECVQWTTAANIGLYTHCLPMLGKHYLVKFWFSNLQGKWKLAWEWYSKQEIRGNIVVIDWRLENVSCGIWKIEG